MSVKSMMSLPPKCVIESVFSPAEVSRNTSPNPV